MLSAIRIRPSICLQYTPQVVVPVELAAGREFNQVAGIVEGQQRKILCSRETPAPAVAIAMASGTGTAVKCPVYCRDDLTRVWHMSKLNYGEGEYNNVGYEQVRIPRNNSGPRPVTY